MTGTGPGGGSPRSGWTPTERALREAMERSVADLADVPDLMAKARVRAGRIERRRRAVLITAGGALAVVAAAGGTTLLTNGRDGGGVVTVEQPAMRQATPPPVDTSPTGSSATSSSATGSAPTRTTATPPTPPTRSGPARSTGAATGKGASTARSTGAGAPAGPWSAVQVDDGFTGSAVDLGRWTPYTGEAQGSPTGFSPQAVTVQGGALHITVDRDAGRTPAVRGGGVKDGGSQRYGRWEVRWRMTAAPGVTSEFLLLGDGPGGIGQIATLSPAERKLTIDDRVRGTSKDVPLDGTAYHVVTLESTPQGVRWLVDGRVVVDEPGGAPTVPVTVAVQSLVSLADCGATPLPAECAAPATYPVRLDVDYFRSWAYQP